MVLRARPAGLAAALVIAATFALHADADPADPDAELQVRLGTVMFEDGRYNEALEAFDRAVASRDTGLALRARKGKIRSALRVAAFDIARSEAEALRGHPAVDADGISLYGDALWASGRFDEADRAYLQASERAPAAPRARFGRARTLSTVNRLDEALDLALAASDEAAGDAEIIGFVGELYARMGRYSEAASTLRRYITLLPAKERSRKTAWARGQIQFFESFRNTAPLDIDREDRDALHTVPFRLVKDKVVMRARINGGRPQDVVLDTGSETTVLSAATARRERVSGVAYTVSAGVGEVGVRDLQVGRLRSLDLGTLQVRNVPVLIKTPALRGIPVGEGDSFSPLSIGLSVIVDYQKRLLTIGRSLPLEPADHRLPMRLQRLAMVKGVVNGNHSTYFVVDTGGEVISISVATAGALPPSPYRRIPLRVWGTSGWDREAFLMPGVDLDFEALEYRKIPLVVLNLHAPSALLGFQLGGIVGHQFLAPYRVALDLQRSELRLQKP